MKTNKSLLVKFLTVLCALCLSLSVAFGLVACGEETVSVVGAEINSENKLVLTYSDGTTKTLDIVGKDGVDGEDGEDLTKCAHTNSLISDYKMPINEINVEAKLADVCTMQQAICLDCDHLYVIANGHDYKDVEALAATCYSEGHEAGKECKECGYFTGGKVTEKVAHTPGHYFVAYNDPSLTTCVDGGFTVTICEACKAGGAYEDDIEGNELEVTYVQTSGLGHSSTDWKKHDNDPTLASAGTLIAGKCDECGTANVTMDLPKLDEVNYVKTTKVAKVQCTDTETYNYQIKVGEQTFDFEVVSDPGNHKISDTIVFEDGKVYNYDATLFTKFGNAQETCANAGFDVFFTCKDCNQPIQTKAKTAHETVFENAAKKDLDAPEVDEHATCEGFGYYKAYDCSVCGTHIDAPEALQFAKLGHEYKAYAIVGENADGTVDLSSKCTRYDVCGEVDTIAKAAATYAKEDATCEAKGKETWTVTSINGVALETPLVAEKEIAIKPHMLGEEAIDLTKVYDWTVYEAKGFIGFANVVHTCEENGFDVFFYCSECEKPITVRAEVPHKVPADPDTSTTVNEAIVVVDAKCGVIGTETYECAVCGEEQVKEIPALVHEYKYTMVTSDTNDDDIDDWAVITGTCVHGDKHVVADPEDEPYKTIEAYNGALSGLTSTDKVVATCEVDGIKVYSWTPAGSATAVTAEVNVGKTQHKLNNGFIDESKVYDIGNGIVAMGNSTPACNSTVPGQGMFTCEVCEKPISVQVKQAHTKPATGVVEVKATCSNKGTIDYTCTVCLEAVHIESPALEHVVSYKANTLVLPTENQAGEVYVGCATCETQDAKVVLPALNTAVLASEALATDNFTYVVATEATCEDQGKLVYTYVDATYGAFSFDVVTSRTGHGFVQPPFSWTYNGFIYTGRICKDCGKLIVESKVAVPQA